MRLQLKPEVVSVEVVGIEVDMEVDMDTVPDLNMDPVPDLDMVQRPGIP